MTNTLAKFEGKLEATAELGERCQEQALAAEHEAQQRKGGADALRAMSVQLHQQLCAILDKEWDDGEFAECTAPEFAKAKVKRTISRAVGLCENLSQVAKNAELIASGKATALRGMAEIAGKYNDVAAARIRQLKSPPEPVVDDVVDVDGKGNPRRAPGERPVTRDMMITTEPKPLRKKPSTTKKSGKKKSGKRKG